MRYLTAAVLSLALASGAKAAEIEAQSQIDAVTVFPAGAEVERTAKVTLDKGEATLVFRDLPAGAVGGSIRVEGKASGNLEIGSVDTRRMFVPQADAAAAETERRRIEDELDQRRDEKAALEAAVQAAETQKTLITNLTELPNRPAPSAGSERPEDWPAILALIVTGTADAERTRIDAEAKLRELNRTIEDLEKKLASLSPPQQERTEVKVNVVAETPLEADVTVRYQVRNASWTPLYDARLTTGAKTAAPKLSLTRRASITQRTGEVWDNVAVTLSTTRPNAGASVPELQPLTVDFEQVRPPPPPMAAAPMARNRDVAEEAGAQTEQDEATGLGMLKAKKVDVAERGAEVIAAPFQALFAVPGRLTVPDTGEAKRVQLLEESIEPQLTVRTVPREDAKAYLYAKLVLPKGTPLLPGTVSLFRDGTFVGVGKLPVLSPGEEHELGFGVDDLVRVRQAVTEEKRGETGLISTSRTDSRNYKLSVKNMHERSIGLIVYDRVPVSQNQDIKVELKANPEPTKQNVDDKRGVLAWESTLEPDQEQVIEFAYRVTWPSSKSIVYGR